MRLTSTTDVRGDVTLVECTVENDGPDRARLRVESRLDGPVWPPRRHGRPGPGWEGASGGDGGDGPPARAATLAPGESVSIGFASPAAPVEPPVAVETVATGAAVGEDGPTAGSVLADCGDPRPPRAALPAASRPGTASPDAGARTGGAVEPDTACSTGASGRPDAPDGGTDGSAPRHREGTSAVPSQATTDQSVDRESADAAAASDASTPSPVDGTPTRGRNEASTLPEPVHRWLAGQSRSAAGPEGLTAADRRRLVAVVERAAAALDADAAGPPAGPDAVDDGTPAAGSRRTGRQTGRR